MPTVPVQAQIDWVNRTRVAVTDLVNAIDRLKALRTQWDYLGLNGKATAASVAGTNHEGITEANFGDALNSVAAIVSLLDSGHGTNLYRLLWPIR